MVNYGGALQIEPSHRGLGVQLRDEGDMERIHFRNITLTAQLCAPSWWGAGEAISVTCLPRTAGQKKLGTIKDITFEDIRAVSEGGIVLRGTAAHALGSVHIVGMIHEMRKLTTFPGGERDLQPGPAGLERLVTIPAIYAQNVNSLEMSVRAGRVLKNMREHRNLRSNTRIYLIGHMF